MNAPTKIHDMTLRYGVSTRTLRYYEDMGLIRSVKTEDYAYRCYDDNAEKRLEQILLLRKLNIGIKDIQRIFASDHVQTLLEVLDKKVDDIDAEASLLYELKNIVLAFIRQIKEFERSGVRDIQLVYEKANEFDKQMEVIECGDNSVAMDTIDDVAQRLVKMQDVRIVRLPAMPMILSPHGSLEEERGPLQVFYTWCKRELMHGDDEYPYGGGLPIFTWDDGQGFQFLVKKPDGFTNNSGYPEFEFRGGLYAVFSAWLPDLMDRYNQFMRWLDKSAAYRFDDQAAAEGRYPMSHIVTPPEVMTLAHNEQQDVFVPICLG